MALLQQIINGLSLGSIYALIALGYTMVYGIIKLINFAHGDIYMIGAFIGLYCGKNLGLSLLPTLIISMIGAALCGVIIEKVAYKPLRNSPRITLLITAIGISLLLENGMKLAVGSSPKAFPKLLSTEVIKLGSLSLETSKILMLVVSIMLVVFLQFIVFKTKIGKAMRAASYDIEDQGDCIAVKTPDGYLIVPRLKFTQDSIGELSPKVVKAFIKRLENSK